MGTKFTYDDILLVPSRFESYNDDETNSIDYTMHLFGKKYIPIMSSPMDTITGREMLLAMSNYGAVGVHHRYATKKELEDIFLLDIGGIAVSPSMGVDFITEFYHKAYNIFCMLDVAHADTDRNINFCKDLIANGVDRLIAGSLVTDDAVLSYYKIGVNHFRVGVGNGSVCSTRSVTGFGYPQGSAIFDLSTFRTNYDLDFKIIADGGINSTGDIIKAFVLGADFVMSGRLFAGAEETPIPGVYRGMASKEALSTQKKDFFVEGEAINVPQRTHVKDIILNVKEALIKGCYYGGVHSVKELRNVKWNFISSGTFYENQVRRY